MTRYTGDALAQTQSSVVHPVILVSAFGRYWTMHDAPVTVDGVTYEPQAMHIHGLTEAQGTDVHNLNIQLPATDEFLRLSREYNQVRNSLFRGGDASGWNLMHHVSVVPTNAAPTGYVLQLAPTQSESAYSTYVEGFLHVAETDVVTVAGYCASDGGPIAVGVQLYQGGFYQATQYIATMSDDDGGWHYTNGVYSIPAGIDGARLVVRSIYGNSTGYATTLRLSHQYTWSPISMRVGYIDADGKPVTGIPSQGYIGNVVSVNPSYSADGNGIEIVAQDFNAYMGRPGGLRFNSEDHQTRPGASNDTFFDNLPRLKGRKVQWLSMSVLDESGGGQAGNGPGINPIEAR